MLIGASIVAVAVLGLMLPAHTVPEPVGDEAAERAVASGPGAWPMFGHDAQHTRKMTSSLPLGSPSAP